MTQPIDIPLCAAADPFPQAAHFRLPEGSCDTHAHVFGPMERYPYTPNRTYTPPDAAPGAYLHLHRTLGISRGVLVQPSVYGTDNRLMVDCLHYLRRQGLQYKGVAVVDAAVSERELDELTEAGVCGVRMNLLFKGGIAWRDVENLSRRLAERNWHLQFLIDVSEFEEMVPRIRRLPTPVVIDHMGHMDTAKGLHQPGFQGLLTLVREQKAWVKLSGSYRITHQPLPPYLDVVPFARALIAADPAQILWGSDWPHPHFNRAMPGDGPVLDMLADWAPDEATRHRILVDNPARLYGFPSR
ncbi:amidohydrolase family protein [Zobellella aerophila]|uniref:Amidohydrolase n=1 Tax=Zobellella aerophila TaxID=870480 RepID=A0ABP6W894_9GAMM